MMVTPATDSKQVSVCVMVTPATDSKQVSVYDGYPGNR